MIKPLKLKSNKKGISDVIVVMIIFFVIAISLILAILISNSLRTTMTPALSLIDNRSGQAFDDTLKVIPQMADTIFMIVLVMFIIGIFITSYLFYSHPIFMILYIILSLGALLLSVILGNMYETISTNSAFNTTITSVPIMQNVMTHFPLLIIGIIAISLIIIYAKSQQRTQNSGGTI